MNFRTMFFAACYALLSIVIYACGGDSGADCNIDRGEHHEAGRQDPQQNCVECHEGLTKCISCHSNNDHTVIHDGVKHMSSDDKCCQWCHGPDNAGGLGKSCSECH